MFYAFCWRELPRKSPEDHDKQTVPMITKTLDPADEDSETV